MHSQKIETYNFKKKKKKILLKAIRGRLFASGKHRRLNIQQRKLLYVRCI